MSWEKIRRRKYWDYSSFLHTKVTMEGEINMSSKMYDANVAGGIKGSFALLLKETTLAFPLLLKRMTPICLQ